MKQGGPSTGLRRDLGTLEAYAALVGILVGAGIFRVTGTAWALTGSSVILGYLVLAPAVMATSVAYCVYLSTPLGKEPGGEYTHLAATFADRRIAFIGAWLKTISYLGALSYLASALADYILEMAGASLSADVHRLPLAIGSLVFFWAAHVFGIRWFGRIQVVMCALLGLSIVVLVIPGLFAIKAANYQPFFSHGAAGFAGALFPLFFAYAGFESLAQAAGEVKDSTRRLPAVFARGLGLTTIIFLLMSVVAFGVLPGERLGASAAPMVAVAEVYLPAGAAWFVNLGAIMAIATSLNATMLVPSRLGIVLARDGLAPRWLGAIPARTGTPVAGVTLTLAIAVLLLVSGGMSLALDIAVLALVCLYFLHSLAYWLLPRLNPVLEAQATVRISPLLAGIAAWISMISMGALIVVQGAADLPALFAPDAGERLGRLSFTGIELLAIWSVVGAALYATRRKAQVGSGVSP